nr:hypothetical protein HAGR004_21980 [Bdellovibrio sp. HAGR004]
MSVGEPLTGAKGIHLQTNPEALLSTGKVAVRYCGAEFKLGLFFLEIRSQPKKVGQELLAV